MAITERASPSVDLEQFPYELPAIEPAPALATPNHRSLKRKVWALAAVGLAAVFPFNDSRATDKIEWTHPQAEALHGNNLRVMTANVHGWQSPSGGNNIGRLLDTLHKEKPDVACLQEVFADGDELNKLYRAGYNVLFVTTQNYFAWGRFGNAVISKHPLQLDGVMSLPNPDTENPRRALIFDIQADNRKLRFVDLHLSVNQTESRLQTDALVSNLTSPVQGICGDFNQGGDALRGTKLGILIPSFWFRNDDPKPAPTSGRGAIDWILSPCGQREGPLPKSVDIGSDHYGLEMEIDLTSCS